MYFFIVLKHFSIKKKYLYGFYNSDHSTERAEKMPTRESSRFGKFWKSKIGATRISRACGGKVAEKNRFWFHFQSTQVNTFVYEFNSNFKKIEKLI